MSVNDTESHSEVAAVAANRAERVSKRWWHIHIGRPKNADHWSMLLATTMMVGVPLWFTLENWWSPHYTPKSWGWAVPCILAIFYLLAQITLLLHSASKRIDDVAQTDITIAYVTFASVLGTGIVFFMMNLFDRYELGGFQCMTYAVFFVITAGEAFITSWMRLIINKRYFAAVAPGS